MCGNIAEGWKNRRHPCAFVSKPSDSDAEATKVHVWPYFTLACEFIIEKEYKAIADDYDHINRQPCRDDGSP